MLLPAVVCRSRAGHTIESMKSLLLALHAAQLVPDRVKEKATELKCRGDKRKTEGGASRGSSLGQGTLDWELVVRLGVAGQGTWEPMGGMGTGLGALVPEPGGSRGPCPSPFLTKETYALFEKHDHTAKGQDAL